MSITMAVPPEPRASKLDDGNGVRPALGRGGWGADRRRDDDGGRDGDGGRVSGGGASTLRDDCARMERSLLVLARFTGGRRHHRRTVSEAGVGHVETAAERRRRRAQHRARRAADAAAGWRAGDPAADPPPLLAHAATQVDAGLYPVLAVVEDLVAPRPLEIAAALTLDRSTITRHLDTLERRGLLYRERGRATRRRQRRPRVRLTVQGFNAMMALRRARIGRLERAAASWPALERRLVRICLERLAAALHAEAAGLQ